MKFRPGYFLLAGAVCLSACQPASNSDAQSAVDSASSAEQGAQTPSLSSDKSKLSYALGFTLGKQMHSDGMDISLDDFSTGFGHAMQQGGEPLMTDTEVQQRLQAFQQERVQEQQAEFEKLAAKNKTEGEAWLAENAKKEGVVTTESGLQYKVLTEGKGDKPGAEQTVSVHYRGTLVDGTEFDSSYARGEPAEFPVNRVIGGWTEALQLMPVGSKWELYIPSDLAYGQAGSGRDIGPHSTLMFEVELLEIK
ncbi:MAG: FKBP-type peptidyl-prolyl cis-trans isomerase [Pseudomonadales bacterium]